jgi:orotate phosphoribosyltransferase
MRDEEVTRAIRERAVLTGDFVLRSGRRSTYYIDKYRILSDPQLLEAIAARVAETVGRVDPGAVRLAAPELGAVPLATAASLASRLPFVIVRGEAKGYGTDNRLEGGFSAGERVCLVEDIVTSGGAAVEAIQAVREAGLECANGVCVVDREEGGVDALARIGVHLWPLFRTADIVSS